MKLAAGTLPADKAAVAPQLIFNQRLDAALAAFFALVLWVMLLDLIRVLRRPRHEAVRSTEAPYVMSHFPEAARG